VSFGPEDLTLIIPSVAGREGYLLRTLGCLATDPEVRHVVVVWDSTQPVSPSVIEAMQPHWRLIAHERNRGSGAARNSGASRIETALGMYLDDDIVPSLGFLRHHLEFHSMEPATDVFAVGRVTWAGTDAENALTRWRETHGDWRPFNATPDKAPFPFFPSGFTSFKREAARKYSFNETFTQWGYEDTEVGHRLERAGGGVVFLRDCIGLHIKQCEVTSYDREQQAFGFNRAYGVTLYPDLLSPAELPRFLDPPVTRSAHDGLVALAEALLRGTGDPTQELGCLLPLITSRARAEGSQRFFLARYPGLEEALARESSDWGRDPAAVARLCQAAPHLGHLWMLLADLTHDRTERHHALRRAVEAAPGYVRPRVCLFEETSGAERDDAFAALQVLKKEHGARLTARAYAQLTQVLGTHDEALGTLDARIVSTREVYLSAERARLAGRGAEVLALLAEVLAREPAHAGALLTLTELAAESWPDAAPALATLARHVIATRPLEEQPRHLSRLGALALSSRARPA
jgi:hypothetical protein